MTPHQYSQLLAWVAGAGFWILMVLGYLFGELRLVGAVTFVALWLAAMVGFPHVPYGAALAPSFVALLDIVLVLVIFKGDVKLS